MSVDALMPTLMKLSAADRRKLIDRLWDSLPESLEPSEVPEWHIEILKKRLAKAKANPGKGITWEAFKAKMRAKR